MKNRPRLIIGVVAGIVLIVAGMVFAFSDFAARHLGYARPWSHGLPDRITRHGRDYSGHPGSCLSMQQLQAQFPSNYFPLEKVGSFPTLFGSSHDIYVFNGNDGRNGMTTMALEVGDGANCYVGYSIEGGP